MSLRGRVGRVVGTGVIVLSAAATSCSSSEDEPSASGGAAPALASGGRAEAGRSGGGGAAGSSSGGTPMTVGVGGGSVVGLGGSIGAGGAPAACAVDTVTAKLVPLDLYLMLDSSESMLGRTSGGSDKWTEIGEALVSFLRDPGSAGLGVGLQYFPIRLPDVPDACSDDAQCGQGGPCQMKVCLNVALAVNSLYPCSSEADCDFDLPDPPACITLGDCSTDPDSYCITELAAETCDGSCTQTGFCSRLSSCDVPTYAAPEVAIAELPGVEPAIVRSLQARLPTGKTPTAPALDGAIEHAKTWQASHPDRQVVVLLATDGLPTECLADDDASVAEAIAEVAAIAERGLSDGVRTFVIGVFAQEDLDIGARENLSTVAVAGGTDEAFIVNASGDVTTQFLAALSEIRGQQLSCELQVPTSEPGREVDFDRVNVDFTSAGTTTRIPRVIDAAGCDAVLGGWYYDVAPSAGTPRRITVCPTSCSLFQRSGDAAVSIELGCASETIE